MHLNLLGQSTFPGCDVLFPPFGFTNTHPELLLLRVGTCVQLMIQLRCVNVGFLIEVLSTLGMVIDLHQLEDEVETKTPMDEVLADTSIECALTS